MYPLEPYAQKHEDSIEPLGQKHEDSIEPLLNPKIEDSITQFEDGSPGSPIKLSFNA